MTVIVEKMLVLLLNCMYLMIWTLVNGKNYSGELGCQMQMLQRILLSVDLTSYLWMENLEGETASIPLNIKVTEQKV